MNVKVWNKNDHDFKETFKGDLIEIKAHDYVEMDYEEAVIFLGKATPIIKMKSGLQDPRSFKRLWISDEDKAAARDVMGGGDSSGESEKVFACHACSKEFRTKNGLLKHTKDKHISQMEKDAADELLDNEDLD